MSLQRRASICYSRGMTQEEELTQVQAERTAWREIAYEKHQEVLQLQQEKQTLREALGEAIQAIYRKAICYVWEGRDPYKRTFR